MSEPLGAQGRSVVVQPGDGRSWWQPTPANGHADPVLVPAETGFDGLSMGYQTIAPGGRVREHSHAGQVNCRSASADRERSGSTARSTRWFPEPPVSWAMA